MVKYKIYLGSKSPRRRELLGLLGINFDILDTQGPEEVVPPGMKAEAVAEYLSKLKNEALLPLVSHIPDALLITADTLVILDGEPLGKPGTDKEAKKMLARLSGHTHEVITGVTLGTHIWRKSFSVSTNVKFSELTDEEIAYYVDTFHPLDKAGAYGIQEWIGAVGVEKIEGSFYNVMGLPLSRLYKELKTL